MATTETADADPWDGWDEWRASDLYADWYDRVVRGDPDDYVIAVTASSHTGISGTGKSTLLTILGQEFDVSAGGYDAEQKATVDVRELARDRVPEVENYSAVVADEIQGLMGTHGLDSRRGMRQSSIDAINSILAARDKSLTVILGAQHMAMLDVRLYPIVDSWLLIRHQPSDPFGPLATHHKMLIDDYDLKSANLKTPAIEDLTWPRVPHDDPDYQVLTDLKHRYKTENYDPTTGENVDPKAERDDRIHDLYHERGLKQSDIAEHFGLDQSTVSRILNGDS